MLKSLVRIRKLLQAADLMWPSMTPTLRDDIVGGSRIISNPTQQYGILRADGLGCLGVVFRHAWSAEQWHAMSRFICHYEVVDGKVLVSCEEVVQKLWHIDRESDDGPRKVIVVDVTDREEPSPHPLSGSIPRSSGDGSPGLAASPPLGWVVDGPELPSPPSGRSTERRVSTRHV